MYKYLVDKYYIASGIIPDWQQGTRLQTLRILDLWYESKFYDVIATPFHKERDGNRQIMMEDRAPSFTFNFPNMLADLTSRKIFAGRHIPRLTHEDPEFLKRVRALVAELRLPQKMLEAAKRGSVGSVLMLYKMLPAKTPNGLEARGCVDIICAQYATPTFNKFEELESVLVHFIKPGYELMRMGFARDNDGNPIVRHEKYWHVKCYDTMNETLYVPIKERKWNPISGDYSLLRPVAIEGNPYSHNLGFVQGIWIKNLTGGSDPDGKSTFAAGLNNFIEQDYLASQNGRGIRYSAAPQVVIKGNLLGELEGSTNPTQNRDPGYLIRLSPDLVSQMGGDKITGHDAFLLETNGQSAKATDEFLRAVKRATFEQLCSARKDLESIKGSMSGKAIELIDEDFLDLIQELRTQYGDYGYLPLVKKVCKSATIAGSKTIGQADDQLIDGLGIDYPPLYLPDPQEVLFLVQAMEAATVTQQPGPKTAEGGETMIAVTPLIEPEIAQLYMSKALDLYEDSYDKKVIENQEIVAHDAVEEAKPDGDDVAADNDMKTGLLDDLAVKPMTGLNASRLGY